MANGVTECPVCAASSARLIEGELSERDAETFECPRCGCFRISFEARVNLESIKVSRRLPISTYAREMILTGGRPARLTTSNVDELIDSYWPRGIGERIDRALVNLGKLSRELGQPLDLTCFDNALLYSHGDHEMEFIIHSLAEMKYIVEISIDRSNEIVPDQVLWRVYVSAQGWDRINKLQSVAEREKSKRVFVAMWFHEETKRAYDEGISPAIRDDCGFDPRRIDLKEFNEDIVAEIIAEIRACRFLVADLTGDRKGVYFEAGFAKGLGIPTIFTCRESDFTNAHFDVNHFNCIVWNDVPELRKKLTNRIRATINGAKLA